MGPFHCKAVVAPVLMGLLASGAWASPLSSRLLPLVPPGAAIVAGFENHGTSSPHGHLLLTTRNNRLDLEDFQSLVGVDSKRIFEEVIEVAAATPGGNLSEHMLLVGGRFDRERIFGSLEENGASSQMFLGEKIVLIRPFAREQEDMLEIRWLVIPDKKTALLGTPFLVQEALRRRENHALPDPVLEERLSLLRPDVHSWNVLAQSLRAPTRIDFAQPQSRWAQLQQGADVLMVAVRFGTKIRVDFSIHADAAQGAEFFEQKAEVFADALADMATPDKTPVTPKRRLGRFVLQSDRVQGSVDMSFHQFERWCQRIYLERAVARGLISSGN
jgi:hypothetical protein